MRNFYFISKTVFFIENYNTCNDKKFVEDPLIIQTGFYKFGYFVLFINYLALDTSAV